MFTLFLCESGTIFEVFITSQWIQIKKTFLKANLSQVLFLTFFYKTWVNANLVNSVQGTQSYLNNKNNSSKQSRIQDCEILKRRAGYTLALLAVEKTLTTSLRRLSGNFDGFKCRPPRRLSADIKQDFSFAAFHGLN